jgi:hypothetical protein
MMASTIEQGCSLVLFVDTKEAVRPSETSVNFYQTARHDNPHDIDLQLNFFF